jgi:hypothetical protein
MTIAKRRSIKKWRQQPRIGEDDLFSSPRKLIVMDEVTDYGLPDSERLTLYREIFPPFSPFNSTGKGSEIRIGESGRIYRGFLDPKSGKPSAERRGHHQGVLLRLPVPIHHWLGHRSTLVCLHATTATAMAASGASASRRTPRRSFLFQSFVRFLYSAKWRASDPTLTSGHLPGLATEATESGCVRLQPTWPAVLCMGSWITRMT